MTGCSVERESLSPVHLSIFGAPIATGNLGLSALGLATLYEIDRRVPEVFFTLFDHGRGVRALMECINGRGVRGEERGAWISRRIYRGESLWTMRAASRLAPWSNDNIRAIDSSAGILDISGGDSFSDLYGRKQLNLVLLPKQIALQRRRPLILLPQTYGPFSEQRAARQAIAVLGAADQVWARDRSSYDWLQEFMGSRFDPEKHRSGVDVAFALPPRDPGPRIGEVGGWFRDENPVIGINISGLLAMEGSGRRFGLIADPLEAMVRLVKRFLSDTDLRVLLVPHVRGNGVESDDAACARVLATVDSPSRLACLPPGLTADETKHVIAQLAWFAGARMHATIAALSSRVPVAAVAYSDKFQGVFDACGVGERVLDARRLTTEELSEAMFAAWGDRRRDAEVLTDTLPCVEAMVARQFDELVALLAARRGS
jgi:colanic acid/amylovoran biosynthesis protein